MGDFVLCHGQIMEVNQMVMCVSEMKSDINDNKSDALRISHKHPTSYNWLGSLCKDVNYILSRIENYKLIIALNMLKFADKCLSVYMYCRN